MTSRGVRATAWVALVSLGALNAYAHRHAISPDGVSYLDLSDAVLEGRISGLVNLYWSPLYPALLGIARAIFGAGARVEIPILHAVNFILFVGALGAFEYLLMCARTIAAATRGAPLRSEWGELGAYLIFAGQFFAVVGPDLTTPDLLSNAAVFLALGALLRLHVGTADARNRKAFHAIVLGASLGMGILAKSFFMPWSIVCLAALTADYRRVGRRQIAIAAGSWAIIALPWTAMMSARAGHLTFGEAGRLTFAWYATGQSAPSTGMVPPDARTAATDSILPGIGMTGPAPGTDPMWFDPARWNASVQARWTLARQLENLHLTMATLFVNVSVLCFAIVFIAIASADARRSAWRMTWPAVVPSVAGIAAYSLVIVTARYVAPFIVALLLLSLAAVPVTRIARPKALLAGLLVSFAPLALIPLVREPLPMAAGLLGALLVGVAVRMDRLWIWALAVSLALLVALLNLSPQLPLTAATICLALIVILWRMSVSAERGANDERFARALQAALSISLGFFLVGRVLPRVAADLRLATDDPGSLEWRIAEELRAHGITPGTPIALIGPHAESYWARTARLKIVADVPAPLAQAWWTQLSSQRRAAALEAFAGHGARVAIAVPPVPSRPDSGWVQLQGGAWARPLAPTVLTPR